MLKATAVGALLGMGLAVVVLFAIAFRLLLAQGAALPALITIWLWFLPALAVFGLAGSLAATCVERLGMRRR